MNDNRINIRGGPFADFVILHHIDDFSSDLDFANRYLNHDYPYGVGVSMDTICLWIPLIYCLKTCFHSFDNPLSGLAFYGVTLIPPESLAQFMEIIRKSMHLIAAGTEDHADVLKLLDLLEKAESESKWVVHLGV